MRRRGVGRSWTVLGAVVSVMLSGAAGAPAATAAPGVVVPSVGLGWGAGGDGQLTAGTGQVPTPTPVLLPAGTTSVVLGRRHSLALTEQGTIVSWGAADGGLLGAERAATPLDGVPPGARVVSLPTGQVATGIAADESHSLVVTRTGAVFAWGANDHGQLGDGSDLERGVPVEVLGLPPVQAVATGTGHSLAITTDGRLFAWGAGDRGQLGTGGWSGADRPVQVAVPAGHRVVSAAAGEAFSVAVTDDGRVLTWGGGGSGQQGDGARVDRPVPAFVDLPGGSRATSVVAGRASVSVLTEAGAVVSWGANQHGQLGDGTTEDRTAPVGTALPPGAVITQLSMTGDQGVALTSTGAVLSWGDNRWGQLGDGSHEDHPSPRVVTVPDGEQVTAVAAGYFHDVAIVASAGLARIAVDADSPVVLAGVPVTFTLTGFDDHGHFLGRLRAGATLALDGGRCDALTCTSTTAGEKAVTASIGSATGRTFVRILPAGAAGPTTTPGPTPTGAPTPTAPASTSGPPPPPLSTPAAPTTSGTSAFAPAPATTSARSALPGSRNGVATPEESVSGSLSWTGVSRWLPVAAAVAAGLVVAGGALVLAGRRRRPHTTPEEQS